MNPATLNGLYLLMPLQHIARALEPEI
jgi:hypothetical protein